MNLDITDPRDAGMIDAAIEKAGRRLAWMCCSVLTVACLLVLVR